jgi:hypothetical protein
VKRWYKHIKSYTAEFSSLPGSSKAGEAFTSGAAAAAPAAAADDDEDIDLFGEDEEEDAEAERIKAERVAAYNAKKANKPKTIAKVCCRCLHSGDADDLLYFFSPSSPSMSSLGMTRPTLRLWRRLFAPLKWMALFGALASLSLLVSVSRSFRFVCYCSLCLRSEVFSLLVACADVAHPCCR